MTASVPISPELQDLIEREKINQCLLRYTRGIDRLDVELIRSAFHPDAIDYHAKGRRGSAQAFLDWWVPTQAQREVAQHFLTNVTIDMSGDTAHVESYFITLMKSKGQDTTFLTGGRYIDRMEKRNGEWRIALRLVHIEWTVEGKAAQLAGLSGLGTGTRDRADPSYMRPLQIPAALSDEPAGR
ncbi:MAG TPA: nuclear transport factor 2 family protein [Steroidobacteraceae bacterium]|nr:nuclear transport factor 2 family protein [Steroidobacteraceae bacterium]